LSKLGAKPDPGSFATKTYRTRNMAGGGE